MTPISRVVWTIGAVLSLAVAVLSYRYLAHVGPVPPNIARNANVDPWIVIHAGSAATALLVGPAQFLTRTRRHRPHLHRWAGRIYVLTCLVGGFSALVLARGVSTGPVAAAGFATLGLFWNYATARGWLSARACEFGAHRRWMIRSFAMTFAAVTLRLYLPIVIISGMDFTRSYQAIAWLCWVPNILLAELYLRRSRGRDR